MINEVLNPAWREEERKAITDEVMADITQFSRKDRLVNLIGKKYEPSEDLDHLSRSITQLRIDHHKAVEKGQEEEFLDGLEKKVYEATDYMPNYNKKVTKFFYGALKFVGNYFVFNKVTPTGAWEQVRERAKEGRLAILARHVDMFDTILYAYPFLEDGHLDGKGPPTYMMGDNLNVGWNSYLLKMFNSMFIKRKNSQNHDRITLSKILHRLFEKGHNMVIYPDGTRSRDGKIAPIRPKERYFMGKKRKVKAMRTGYLGYLFDINNNIKEDMWITVASASSPLFTDVIKDHYKEVALGKKTKKINTIKRLFSFMKYRLVHPDSGIVVRYSEPILIPKGTWNNKVNRAKYSLRVRRTLKKSITALPENIMAYTLRYIEQAESSYEYLNPKQRRARMKELFVRHTKHIIDTGVPYAEILEDMDKSFEIALKFNRKLNMGSWYRRNPALTRKLLINKNPIVEYNSNSVQHYFKDTYPLPQEKQTLVKMLKAS
ncbi:MAG: 1-acyl-sn-glycerol-3-phosphate acyltransferase [Candidatus Cloacimonetes bacterium]|nr:1-acyl-sn-glycerol-3-phosphate acyltransferase [Candidatus Cloacimonadota bacterium]